MLQEVRIFGPASYAVKAETLSACKQVNFIFGTNGSGKTTISRVIANPAEYSQCVLTWKNGRQLQSLVYNRDYADRNYQSTMPGIFTLGDAEIGTQEQIDAKVLERDGIEKEITRKESALKGEDGEGGKRNDLKTLRAGFEATCWLIFNLHDAHFSGPFTGLRNSKSKFCDRLLSEHDGNISELCDLEDLKARAATVFQAGLQKADALPTFNMKALVELESDPILAKKVVGKSDVNVAALITRLGSSDWVKAGRSYLQVSDPQCPFCQQELLTNLAEQLEGYFDETYENDMAEIGRVQQSYQSYSEAIKTRLGEILVIDSNHLDNAAVRAEAEILAQKIELNVRQLALKAKEARHC